MTRFSLPPFGAIPPFSVRDLNSPIVTFVGRLDASQKGFDIFLDAIELVDRSSGAVFSAWLVGGGAEEVENVVIDILRRPVLAAMHAAGRLTLWGRVDIDSLPELFSRSTLVAMPSRRETFGLVAVQAMLCGAAVAASFVGGLKHTIIHRSTGAHFQTGNATALAFIIMALVRNRPLAKWLGTSAEWWSRAAFGDESPICGLHRILSTQEGDAVESHPIENPAALFVEKDRIFAKNIVEYNTSLDLISATNNTTFRATKASGESTFVKVFTERPDYDLSIYRIACTLIPTCWKARKNRSIVAAASPFTVPLLGRSERTLRFHWSEPNASTAMAILTLSRRFGESISQPDGTMVAACAQAYQSLRVAKSWDALYEFDVAAAQLNASLTGNCNTFVRCDARVELTRLNLHLTAGAWPLSAQMRQMMKAVVLLAEALCSDDDDIALLCHGDLNAEHVRMINSAALLCDLEEARFCFGDLDSASLALSILQSGSISDRLLQAVTGVLMDGKGRQGAQGSTLWLIAQALHRALGAAAWGGTEGIIETSEMCLAVMENMKPLTRQ